MTDLTPAEKARIEADMRAYRERESVNHRYGVVGHCIACGSRHEDANDQLACLERHLIAAQNALAVATETIAELKPMADAHRDCVRLRSEVQAMRPSHVKERGR